MNLDVDSPRLSQMVVEEPSGALQHPLFIALHIDLEDVKPSVMQNGIQANDWDHQALSGHSIDSSHARLAATPGSERDDTVLTAHNCLAKLDSARNTIQGDMAAESIEGVGVWLKRNHLAARPDTLSQGECVQAHVGPYVGDDVAGLNALHQMSPHLWLIDLGDSPIPGQESDRIGSVHDSQDAFAVRQGQHGVIHGADAVPEPIGTFQPPAVTNREADPL
jgi:hypothetical protein